LGGWAPSVASDPGAREFFARLQRLAASPGSAMALMSSYMDIDVRLALPLVHAPTLVVHRTGDRMVPVAHGRYLSEHIAGARLVELPGTDHFWWTEDTGQVLDEVEEFLTGVRAVPEADRVLASVLFTDIVDSTRRAVELGDREWKLLLNRHDALAERQVARHGGRLVKTTGDGILATFDGPARSVRCARAISDGAQALGVAVRAGVHTGEVELRGDDIAGLGVNIASRIEVLAQPGEVLVSRTVTDLVAGSGLDFDDRGEHDLKGVPGRWQLFAARV
jgi:class 3 adenylate cyclase